MVTKCHKVMKNDLLNSHPLNVCTVNDKMVYLSNKIYEWKTNAFLLYSILCKEKCNSKKCRKASTIFTEYFCSTSLRKLICKFFFNSLNEIIEHFIECNRFWKCSIFILERNMKFLVNTFFLSLTKRTIFQSNRTILLTKRNSILLIKTSRRRQRNKRTNFLSAFKVKIWYKPIRYSYGKRMKFENNWR